VVNEAGTTFQAIVDEQRAVVVADEIN
jgi:hypothetical protein